MLKSTTNVLIKPILLYASDFWGCLKLPTNNPIETLYMRIYKEILGVSKQTTNIGVLLELGKTTLDIDAIKLGIKNWERVRNIYIITCRKLSLHKYFYSVLPIFSITCYIG